MENSMDQNLSLYHIFNTVAEAGNISHAAKELYISQPAISKAVTRLEQNLETKLFVRSSRGVTLTDSGRMLYEQTNVAFKHLKQAEETIKKNKKLGTGSLKIGVSTTLCKYVLMPYLEKFIKLHPHIKISISCQSTYQTLSLLQKHKVDIGLVGESGRLENCVFSPIGLVEDGFVATPAYLKNLKKRHPESATNPFEYGNLMLLDKHNVSRRYIDEYMRGNVLSTGQMFNDHVLEVSSMDLLIEFAKIGLGIACIITDFVKTELNNGTLTTLPLSIPIQKREIGFTYLRDYTTNKALDAFVTFCKKISTP
ncbi:MAG: LysR family transcriptional regulator [Catonella sp.]|uniref:LysR family transcriptional regulator n=1 Tax=Catonella sp. TaxID=2382125 RepID=UPI003FA13BBC